MDNNTHAFNSNGACDNIAISHAFMNETLRDASLCKNSHKRHSNKLSESQLVLESQTASQQIASQACDDVLVCHLELDSESELVTESQTASHKDRMSCPVSDEAKVFTQASATSDSLVPYNNALRNIKYYDANGLKELISNLGQPIYRAKQLIEWLYGNRSLVSFCDKNTKNNHVQGTEFGAVPNLPPNTDFGAAPDLSPNTKFGAVPNLPPNADSNSSTYTQGITSFMQMTDLPLRLREQLQESYDINTPQIVKRLVSKDGSRKYLLRFLDGALTETVAIPTADRLTVCFSTQSGCAMGCIFCATGKLGLMRSLAPGEMVDQLLLVSKDFNKRISNAVAMGQGEPFANYDATLAAMRLMNNPRLLAIGARHITISTCGVISGIRKLAAEPKQFTLAVSLHSAIQKTRDHLMPKMKSQPLNALHKALCYYASTTGRRPTLEYSLIAGVNNSEQELRALIAFAKGDMASGYDDKTAFHVNLIALNDTHGVNASSNVYGNALLGTSEQETSKFCLALQAAGIQATIRSSRGGDIAGACGQLASELTK
ncbi:MAG: radical SAM protein [Coriobacteriales bacterium]|nr:radical SAM protein [Coriobacteriales bacterium]